MRHCVVTIAGAIILGSPALGQPVTPLFASNDPLRIEIRGPISAIIAGPRDRPASYPARLAVIGSGAAEAIMLTPRGRSRLLRDTCNFPPLRVEFLKPPPATSLFGGQRRLKLVTHCRPAEAFQHHVLLEYAAYRLYNILTPASFRARLATIDYVNPAGRAHVSRVGFLIEDKDDVGRRIGERAVALKARVGDARLDPRAAARVALFQYMIGNLDWSMNAGPAGEDCCHNSRLFAAAAAPLDGPNLVAVPYDFDSSGLVDAPYATPPAAFSTGSVRERVFRGLCRHRRELLATAADFRSHRTAMLAQLNSVPGLDERPKRRAIAYLESFFADIATDQRFTEKVLKNCLGMVKGPG